MLIVCFWNRAWVLYQSRMEYSPSLYTFLELFKLCAIFCVILYIFIFFTLKILRKYFKFQTIERL